MVSSPLADKAKSVQSAALVMTDECIEKASGYKTVLHRGLGAVANFAFGFTEVAVLASFTSLYGTSLSNGGPATLVWCWLVTWFMLTLASFSMAEICSAYPSAGSVYHWSAQLVPARYSAIASYICGWANFVGNVAGDASFANFFGSFFSSALEASGIATYSSQAAVGVSIGVLLLWSVLNMFRVDQVGWINNLAAFVHAGSIIVIIVVILYYSSTAGGGPGLQPGDWVWFDFENQMGFTDDKMTHALNDRSYVSAMGICVVMFSFSGFEASAHMAEETKGSATAAPSGIIWTVFATGFGGFAYVLALLYSTTNYTLITNTAPGDDEYANQTFMTSSAAVNTFINACGWKCGSALTWLVLINLWFAGIASVAVTGRITFALLRDKAFPYSDYLVEVHPKTKSPIRSIMFVFALNALLLLLGLNPVASTAFTAIVGLCTIGFMVSYAIPIALKVVYAPVDFPLTPMSLGRWSRPCGIASSLWLFGTSCLFLFPQVGPLDVMSMNWLIVVIGGVFAIGAAYWIFQGHKTFTGPPRQTAIELVNMNKNDGDGTDPEEAAQQAETEEYLEEQYVDQARAAKEAAQGNLATVAVDTAAVAGSAIADAVKSGVSQTGSLLGALTTGAAQLADTTVRVATTGSVNGPAKPKVLSMEFTPSGEVVPRV